MRRVLLILISMLLHGYVGLRLMPSLAGWPAAESALGVLLAASALLLPFSLIGRNLRWPSARTALAWSGMLAMGLFSSLFVLTVLRDALLLTSSALVALWPGALELERIGQATAWAVLAAAATVTVLGVWNARRTAAVVQVDVPVPGLPEALHGFTIAQISDIHPGRPSAAVTFRPSWTVSTGLRPIWWQSPAIWSTAASPNCPGTWRRWPR